MDKNTKLNTNITQTKAKKDGSRKVILFALNNQLEKEGRS